MVRITRVAPGGASEPQVLRVEGVIAGPWVSELAQASAEALDLGPDVVLDLSGVTFVDRDGLEALRRLRGLGVAVVNATAFVGSLLSGGGS